MKTERMHPANKIKFVVNGKILRQGWITVESFYCFSSYKLSKTGETLCYVRDEYRGHRLPIDGSEINCEGSNVQTIPAIKRG